MFDFSQRKRTDSIKLTQNKAQSLCCRTKWAPDLIQQQQQQRNTKRVEKDIFWTWGICILQLPFSQGGQDNCFPQLCILYLYFYVEIFNLFNLWYKFIQFACGQLVAIFSYKALRSFRNEFMLCTLMKSAEVGKQGVMWKTKDSPPSQKE